MIGRTYLERGTPVTVVTRWARTSAADDGTVIWLRPPAQAPRNVLIRRPDGQLVVRPFRGLRKPPNTTPGRL